MYIALSGKMRSGKDTAASLIAEKLAPEKLILLNFSDPLYDVLKYSCDSFNLPYQKNRKFLTDLGDFGRGQNPTVFLDIMQKKIDALKQYPHLSLLVGDARYPNEVDMLRSNGFSIIRIERPDEERAKHIAIEESQSHSSETSLDQYNFDYIIYNNSSLAQFSSRIDSVMTNISMDVEK